MAMAVITSPRNGHDIAFSSDDFDFSISREISVEESSPAGEIFSDGKLLPLSSIATPVNNNILQHHQKAEINNLEEDISSTKKSSAASAASSKSSSFWSIGRSRSVDASSGVSRSMLSSIYPSPRSKSTSSCLDQNHNQNPNDKKRWGKRNQNQRRGPNNNCYYYSGSCKRSNYGNVVRINPVINVHAHFIPTSGGSGTSKNGGSCNSAGNSFFAYLLCNCGDKSTKELGAS